MERARRVLDVDGVVETAILALDGTAALRTWSAVGRAAYDGRAGGPVVRGAWGMRWLWIVIGVLAIVAGVVWMLQGLDVLSGSGMSGQTRWAVIGPIVALVGLGLVVAGVRRRRQDRDLGR